jgi:hypothetical protein
MLRRTWIARLFAAAVTAVAVGGGAASAGMLPTSVTVTPDAGNFRWTYAVVLPTDMKLQAGDYFTIYDFAGMVPGTSSAPAGWQLSISNTGPTPDRLNPQDDPHIPNLTWSYTGPTQVGQVGLGNFWADSQFSQQAASFFTATNPRVSDGQIDKNITETIVPASTGGGGQPGVPEPATLALAGLGIPLIGGARLFRRKK